MAEGIDRSNFKRAKYIIQVGAISQATALDGAIKPSQRRYHGPQVTKEDSTDGDEEDKKWLGECE